MSQLLDPNRERLQELSKEHAAAAAKLEEIQADIMKGKAGFFERIALLSAASIALSLTFLGYIRSETKTSIPYLWLLYTAWGLLLLSLLAALLRNLRHLDYLYYHAASSWLQRRADLLSYEALIAEDKTQMVFSAEYSMMGDGERQKLAGELQTKQAAASREADRSQRKKRVAEVMWRGCEYAAELSFFVGLLLLVVFAMVNTR
jgi:hypothetical protein